MKKLFLTILFLLITDIALAQDTNKCGKLLVEEKKTEYNSCIKNTLDHVEKVSQN